MLSEGTTGEAAGPRIQLFAALDSVADGHGQAAAPPEYDRVRQWFESGLDNRSGNCQGWVSWLLTGATAILGLILHHASVQGGFGVIRVFRAAGNYEAMV